MKNRIVKGLLRFLVTVLVGTACVMAVKIAMNGMYLIGVPAKENVGRVTITRAGESRELADSEEIELAVGLSGFLKYSLFEGADEGGEPLITITYHLTDGKTVTLAANRETVWWKGKPRAIREEGVFVNLTEGLFFPQ